MRHQLPTFLVITIVAAAPAIVAAADSSRPDGLPLLRVGVVYDDTHIRIHYAYRTDQPSWYHQYWIREDGRWVRHGSGDGRDPHGLYEDRISMLLDDGSVEGFARYGGWMTAHHGMRSLDSAVDVDAVRDHPVLGGELGRSDVRKYLPATREVPDAADVSWHLLRESKQIEAMQQRGEFLDLWQWRAHRSHPVGYADNGYVLHYRLSSEGRSMFTDNWDDEAGQPAWIFDPRTTGRRALCRDALLAGEYGQDDLYFLSEDNAAPYDADHDWQDGDVLPQRLLREPSGSRGAIRAAGGYEDGAWRITLTRTLASPNPADSKPLEEGQVYHVAFAVHEAAGARWHRVSLPYTLGLGVEDAHITAEYAPRGVDEAEPAWIDIPLIDPGQITWQWLQGEHPVPELLQSGELQPHQAHPPALLDELIRRHERRRTDP